MRAPFSYENNVSLIRDLLMPDPLPEDRWESLTGAWKASGRQVSLLEWIILEDYLTEEQVLRQMAHSTGAAVWDGQLLGPAGTGAERKILEGNGFLVLGTRDGKSLVSGGPEFPPDLSTYIGEQSGNWSWLLISPLRVEAPGDDIGDLAGAPVREGESSLESWLSGLLEEARLPGTADIHFELTGTNLTIRGRTPKGMEHLAAVDPPRSIDCMRHLKRLAGFSEAENPLPQDGRMAIGHGHREKIYRASHIRTISGESLVLRTISEPIAIPALEELGVPEELGGLLRRAATHGSGFILCTGATGSGKSTTLFSLLGELGELPLKILSIEDPVEAEIPEIIQSSVDEDRNWTFANALRAYLRQDPDIIFVGEIRDKLSAEGAARAALTGHVVLSTLHASGPLQALDRLHGWGLAAGLIAETVRLVSHQRLAQSDGDSGRGRSFQWMEPRPEEVYDYLRGGVVPETLTISGAIQEPPVPSAKA